LKNSINIFWFRRDLRIEDNAGLFNALSSGLPVLPLFIFDTNILAELERTDPRVTFIHNQLVIINQKLGAHGSRLFVKHGDPVTVWKELLEEYKISEVFTNHDYEPYAISRDRQIEELLTSRQVPF